MEQDHAEEQRVRADAVQREITEMTDHARRVNKELNRDLYIGRITRQIAEEEFDQHTNWND